MGNKLLGLVFIICGILAMIGAVVAEIAWLGFCFGTVVIGILMLIFAPLVLFAPLTIIFSTGMALWGTGLTMITDD
jgi:hypothetical protein